MSVQRLSHPGQPTRLVDEGPASVAVSQLASIGALSASAIRETVPGATGGAGPIVRSNGQVATGPLAELTSASAAAEEAWKRKQAADAAWDIAREAVALAVGAVAGIVWPVAGPASVPEPLPPVAPTQVERDQQSRRNGQAAMQAVKKAKGASGQKRSPETRERMRQAQLARHARDKAALE